MTETTQEAPDVRTLILACARSLPEGASPEAYAALERLLKAHWPDDQASEPEPAAEAGNGGRFAVIAFMGHNEYTGYVTEIAKHGQPAYRVDLPERLWGGNPDAYVEYAASAWFSERPRSEESVRKAWESQVRAAAERARREAEWARAREQRALEAASGDGGPDDDEDDAGGRLVLMDARCEKYDLPASSCGHCNGAEARAAQEEARATREPSGPGPWFEARYEGTCVECGEDIRPGDRIRSDGSSRFLCGECGETA